MFNSDDAAKALYRMLSANTRKAAENYGFTDALLTMIRQDVMEQQVTTFEARLVATANRLFPTEMSSRGLAISYQNIEGVGVFWEVTDASDASVVIEDTYPDQHEEFVDFMDSNSSPAMELVREADMYYVIENSPEGQG